MEENLNALEKTKLTSLKQCGRQNNNPLCVHTYEYFSLLGKREFAHVMKNEDLWLKNWFWILQVGSVYSCSPWEAEHLSQLWSKRKMWKGEKIQRAIVAWVLQSRLLTKELGGLCKLEEVRKQDLTESLQRVTSPADTLMLALWHLYQTSYLQNYIYLHNIFVLFISPRLW